MSSKKTIRTRMAPSPTGEMHVGSMAMVLKNYAFAKKHDGQFILRVEDTDKEREIPGCIDQIMQVIHKYGLEWDEGPGKGGPFKPYLQSQRLEIYKTHVQELIEKGRAYHCFCSKERLEDLRDEQRQQKIPPKYDRHCTKLPQAEVKQKMAQGKPYVIRLRVPDHQKIIFNDLIRGEIIVESRIIDDQILLKSDGFPTYHLAVVVDDHLMKISHVMRGEEWISSTPKHVLLYQAFGWELPVFAHIPIFLNPNGKGKMSKRKGTVSAQSFLDKGYLPQALLNFFMILGWASTDQREILSLAEYIQEFDPKNLSKNSVVFDTKKLDWINGVYIRKMKKTDLKKQLQNFLPADFPHHQIDEILPLVKERLIRLTDIEDLTSFFYRPVELDKALLIKRGDQVLASQQLTEINRKLGKIKEWSAPHLEKVIRKLQTETGWHKKQFFMMLRVAVTGLTATPPLFETMAVLGKKRVQERLEQALVLVKK